MTTSSPGFAKSSPLGGLVSMARRQRRDGPSGGSFTHCGSKGRVRWVGRVSPAWGPVVSETKPWTMPKATREKSYAQYARSRLRY